MKTALYDVRSFARWSILVLGGLVAVAGCGEDNPVEPDPVGTVEVAATTTGVDQDTDGYTVILNGGSGEALGPNGTITFSDVSTGEATLELTGVAANCSVSGDNPRSVQVQAGQTASVTFDVACSQQTGDVEATASTSGQDPDSDGYDVILDPGSSSPDTMALAANDDTVTFAGVAAGDHQVRLSGVANNCAVSGDNPRTVNVPADGTGSAAFDVSCTDAVGDLEATASTSGQDQDPDGYTVEVDGTQSQAIGVNGTVTFTGLTAGSHDVELTGVAANCAVSGDNPRTLDVPNGGTASTSFAVSCSQDLGDLEATTSTSGEDPDDGYTVTIDPGTSGELSRTIGANDTTLFENLAEGDHQVELTDVAGNCSVGGNNPRTVNVTFGDTVSTAFDVSCTDMAGSLEATATTTGQDLDEDGYEVVLDPGGSSPDTLPLAVNNDTATFVTTSEDHQVELIGIRDNCSVSGDNPRTVTVVGGDTVETAFDVSCVNREGDLEVSASTTGDQLDPDGYTVTVDPGTADETTQTVGPNGTFTFAALDEGDHAVELSGVANNCWIDGANPRTVSVSFDQTASTTFDVKCFVPLTDPIVFDSDLDEPGNLDIYVVNPDGTGVTRLTNDAADDRMPAVSPDGTKIVFHSRRSGGNDLWIMNADGSNKRQLTDGNDFDPDWAPNGTHITFHRISGGNGDIWFINEDGSELTNLTPNTPGTDDTGPAWSPTGMAIAFSSDREDLDGDGTFDHDIYVMGNDGSGVTAVTSDPGNDHQPQWDPSSCGSGTCQRLAFYSDRAGARGEVFRIQRDGTNEVNLTNTADTVPDYQPSWSPDGSRLVFVSERDGNAELWTMSSSDGSALIQVTNTSGVLSKNPDWSP